MSRKKEKKYVPKWQGFNMPHEINTIYRAAHDRLEPKDQEEIKRDKAMLSHIRGLGETGMEEVLAQIGLLISGNKDEFSALLKMRAEKIYERDG